MSNLIAKEMRCHCCGVLITDVHDYTSDGECIYCSDSCYWDSKVETDYIGECVICLRPLKAEFAILGEVAMFCGNTCETEWEQSA